MHIDARLDWPIHLQLIGQLQAAIEDGDYAPGERLPSVRELAAILRIHRNTVVHAYQALEQAGYVRGEPGRGYFAQPPSRPRQSPAFRALLQETLKRLEDLNEDPVAFAHALVPRALRAQARRQPTEAVVAVVECTMDQATILAHDLSRALQVAAEPVLLSSLVYRDRDELAQFTLFVTTYPHVDEVREALPGRVGDIIPCLLTAHLDTLKALARVPAGSRVGVACVSWEGTQRLREMIEKAGFDGLQVVEGSGEDPMSLPPVLENTALVIAATRVAQTLQAFRPDAPVLIDDRTFTEGSLEDIRARLAGGRS